MKLSLFKKLSFAFTLMTGICLGQQALAETTSANALEQTVEVSQAPQVKTLNINAATAEEIAAQLKGVGLTKAQAIVAFRDLNGPFMSLEEITQVKGIGAATVEKNKEVIQF